MPSLTPSEPQPERVFDFGGVVRYRGYVVKPHGGRGSVGIYFRDELVEVIRWDLAIRTIDGYLDAP